MAACPTPTPIQRSSEHHLARLRAHLREDRLAAVLEALADRFDRGRAHEDSGTVEVHFHLARGLVAQVRADLDERLA